MHFFPSDQAPVESFLFLCINVFTSDQAQLRSFLFGYTCCPALTESFLFLMQMFIYIRLDILNVYSVSFFFTSQTALLGGGGGVTLFSFLVSSDPNQFFISPTRVPQLTGTRPYFLCTLYPFCLVQINVLLYTLHTYYLYYLFLYFCICRTAPWGGFYPKLGNRSDEAMKR
jgi:hypothetical protein